MKFKLLEYCNPTNTIHAYFSGWAHRCLGWNTNTEHYLRLSTFLRGGASMQSLRISVRWRGSNLFESEDFISMQGMCNRWTTHSILLERNTPFLLLRLSVQRALVLLERPCTDLRARRLQSCCDGRLHRCVNLWLGQLAQQLPRATWLTASVWTRCAFSSFLPPCLLYLRNALLRTPA